MRLRILLAVLMFLGTLSMSTFAFSAELAVPQGPRQHGYAAFACGGCGCLRVSYIYHRDLRTTYGTGFDPRNFDQTQPYFYPGSVHAYPRYWVDWSQCAVPPR
jgi:hypothetical protein